MLDVSLGINQYSRYLFSAIRLIGTFYPHQHHFWIIPALPEAAINWWRYACLYGRGEHKTSDLDFLKFF